MILATSITNNYLAGASYWWLTGVNKYSPFANFCLCLDFEPPDNVVHEYTNVTFVPYSSALMRAKHDNNCVQHGDFLWGLPLSETNPVIIFCDADCLMQRAPTTEEITWLNSFGEMTFAAGDEANQVEHRDLYGYGLLMQPTGDYDAEISDRFGGIDKRIYICNGGMLVGRLSAWAEVFDRYVTVASYIFPRLRHLAKQQYTISFVIQQPPFDFKLLPRTFVSHGHDGLHHNVHLVQSNNFNYAYYNNELIMFAHHIFLPEEKMTW
mgnify:CR=1 FL=1